MASDPPPAGPSVDGRPRLSDHMNTRRERVMLASAGFVVTIAIARTVTGILHVRGAGSSGGLVIGDVHLHHYIFGIAILLATSLMWLLLGGIDDQQKRWFRVTAIAYGIGSALILDEFALLLNLKDVYWQGRGRQSIEAIGVFVALLALTVLVRPYGSALRKYRRSR